MKILTALDQSEHAPVILKKAVELAKAQHAELIILTVAEDFLDLGDYASDAWDIGNKALRSAQAAAEDYAEQARSLGLAAKTDVRQGDSPADFIITLAEEEHVDLIVLGSRGRKAIARFLLGSVADKVVTHAPCSVLVVR